jgi:hypothetical protein
MGKDFMLPGNTASCLAVLVLVPVVNVQGHSLTSYQVSFPFVNSYFNIDFSSIL